MRKLAHFADAEYSEVCGSVVLWRIQGVMCSAGNFLPLHNPKHFVFRGEQLINNFMFQKISLIKLLPQHIIL